MIEGVEEERGLTQREQEAIVRAALLAHEGRHAEAEAARFAGGYHNLDDREATR